MGSRHPLTGESAPPGQTWVYRPTSHGGEHYLAPERRAVRVLWASRHALDPAAQEALRPIAERIAETQPDVYDVGLGMSLHQQDITWPAGRDMAQAVADHLLGAYDLVTGVWPAQAVEAFHRYTWARVYGPVSEPVSEPDSGTVRKFRFVRWAALA